jgi:polyisoprenyl-teichoic acid--peptidoglycan teichoic acid transferase
MKNLPIFQIVLLFFCGLVLTACGTPFSPAAYIQPLVAIAPDGATATPTPFQPLAPTPTYLMAVSTPNPDVSAIDVEIASQSPTNWDTYPGPSIWPDIDIPSPVGLLPQPEGQVNILLLGSDQRPDTGGFRTDTILLATINPISGTVNLTSFPRDLYVYIPGWTAQRINTAFGYGGFESLVTTMEYNFGVRPTHYVLINFWSFKEVIDSLGGIDVNAATALTDHRSGYGDYTVWAGVNHMDGETALWYVRSRYTSNDIDRGRRQQEVLVAIFQKLMSLEAVKRAPELYNIYINNVTTNLRFEDVAPLLPLATQLLDTTRIQRYGIGYEQIVPWVNSSGAQVLLPVRDAVLAVMRQALNSP